MKFKKTLLIVIIHIFLFLTFISVASYILPSFSTVQAGCWECGGGCGADGNCCGGECLSNDCDPTLIWAWNSCSSPPPPPPTQVCTPDEYEITCTGSCGGCAADAGEATVRQCNGSGSGWDSKPNQCDTKCAGNCCGPVSQGYNECYYCYHSREVFKDSCTDVWSHGNVQDDAGCGTQWNSECAQCTAPPPPPPVGPPPPPPPGSAYCNVTWSGVSATYAPNTPISNVTATGNGCGNGGCWANIRYKVGRSSSWIGSGININASGPTFKFDINSGSTGSHDIFFGVNSGSTTCNPSKTFITIPSPPTVTLSASPTSITSGESTILTWTVAGNATSCAAVSSGAPTITSGSWNETLGGSDVTNGNHSRQISMSVTGSNGTKTFSINCTNQGGTSATSSVNVAVNLAPWFYCGGDCHSNTRINTPGGPN